MTTRRSRTRAYLLLSRVSNLPTIWSNVLAAHTVAHAPLDMSFCVNTLAMSLFYTGGMFLNDAFDAPYDAHTRPDRPVPAGDVTRREAFVAGYGLLASAEGVLLFTAHPAAAAAWGALLAAAIVFYNCRHKGRAYGPVVMGLCRALVYCGAAAAASVVSIAVLAAAGAMWAYVIALTRVAKLSGPRAGRVVPWLLAGISLVDAMAILTTGNASLAGLAVGAFVLARALQRYVPGT